MSNLIISGYGINQASLRNNTLQDELGASKLKKTNNSPQECPIKAITSYVAREDRAILTEQAARCLEVSLQAIEMAENISSFTRRERTEMLIYNTYETTRDFHEVISEFQQAQGHVDSETMILNLGRLTNSIHPLRLFRKLPTNTLYHITKVLQIHGGGYPLRKMSMGGFSLLEECYHNLINTTKGTALICAFGDLTQPDNHQAFSKLGLINKASPHNSYIHGTSGSVALVVETSVRAKAAKSHPLAEIISVHSLFSPNMFAKCEDWTTIYSNLPPSILNSNPVIVLYDNGAPNIGKAETDALEKCVKLFEIRKYKPTSRYAVATSSLVDLICALADPSIDPGRVIIVHSQGVRMGLGIVILRKLNQNEPGTRNEK